MSKESKEKEEYEKIIRDLHQDYRTVISVFVNLIELGRGINNGYARKIADHALILGISLQLDKKTVDDLHFAGLMHEIGQLCIPEKISAKKFLELDESEKEQLKQIPWLSHTILVPLDQFDGTAKIILQHQEKLDGSGYPRGLKEDQISFAAQVLGVVVDYHKICVGKYFMEKVEPDKAIDYLTAKKYTLYNAKAVDMFLKILDFEKNQRTRTEAKKKTAFLEPGMVLSRPLHASNGILLLPKHHVLTEENIEALTYLEHDLGEELNIFVKRGQGVEATSFA